MSVSNDRMIEIAASVISPHMVGGRLFGDVGAALLSEEGDIYTGVSIDCASWGLCAERSAVAAMITARQYKIIKVAAVWRDERSGALHILPPCGICREFMRSVNEDNLETEVVLGRQRSVTLKELLPLHEWPDPLDMS